MNDSFAIQGLEWRANWRIENGNDSYVVPFPTLRPATLVFHGETEFSYGHYGIHLGQADVLTFLGPSDGTVTGYFIDCRVGSPTAGMRESVTWSPSSARALYIPNGVAHTFDGLERVNTINSYELFLPSPEEWVHGDLDWQPDADIINLPLDVADEDLPYFVPNSHPAGEAWYDLVAARQRASIPQTAPLEYPMTRQMRLADGTVRRVELRRRLTRAAKPAWEPFAGVFGVGWVRHPVIPSGEESGFSVLVDRYPLYFIDHGETGYTHDAYGIHLGQEDRLTFVGPKDQTVTLRLIDTRPDSPTYGADTSFSFTPDPERYLLLPPGVGHAFEHIEKVYTINRPRTLLPVDGTEYLPGNDVIDWPVEKRPIPRLEVNSVPAGRDYYEARVAEQKQLRKNQTVQSTPAVLLTRDENGREIRVALRRKVAAA
ncbi:dTDP-4-dehydrorhamnose 3,5-epimerase family protein [Streptacidiphilus fuscans]|uniref:dTDP-4-dehydrorhamnose 3,5-epimerase family protein n=1 Tax=Streptacidiphilus fuscans TaxID=2789292 RepID=A0A931B0V1_9ACTN|nr:dTDP-4-dehydrorhamnose 3,5-epimerase family protein [Streptacidiphilus fuscans]MBF9068246.1 dTDP-4-dehydrorhamnose 3,5-epimerase family protein [Streptacidiphilus fuscans]